MLKEHRFAQEALELKKTQDREDLKFAYQLARQEAAEAKAKNPLLSQVSALEKIEKRESRRREILQGQAKFQEATL